MKKLLLVVVAIAALGSKAESSELGDLIKGTLLDRVSSVTQLGSDSVRAAVVDSIILIGSYKEKSILHIQAGFNRDTEETDTTHVIYGGQLRLDPFVNARLNLPESWEFLRLLEHGPAVHYDTRKHGWYGYYQVGLAFGLQPKP